MSDGDERDRLMTETETAPNRIYAVHWTVPINYRMRTAAFLSMFASVLVHGWSKGYSPLLWVLVTIQLLVYPHLAYQVARRSAHTRKAEINNLTLDSLMFGMLSAALHFPLWITFTVYIASTLNLSFSLGVPGLLRANFAFCVGVLLIGLMMGWHVSPETAWPVTAICVIANAAYIVSIGLAAFVRSRQLKKARQALHERENTLKHQLAEIRDLQEKLQEQAVRDPLTGLYNRRFLDNIASRELARCEREGLHLSIMMIDVDHFKAVNDTYGHPGGDEVLKGLAALLLENVRVVDVACRFGGEEFLLMLPGMPPQHALERAEQCRAAFASTQINVEGRMVRATISVGIAVYPLHGQTLADLTRCADVALYQAKEGGRNRVVLYEAEVAGRLKH